MPVRFNVGGGGGVTSEDVTATKAYVHPSYKTITKDSNDEVVAGTMPLLAAKTYTPGTANQTIAAGRYLSGVQTIKGDSNLKSEYIQAGITIFGVEGNLNAVVKTSATPLSEGRDNLSGASVGNYCLFAGGASSIDPTNTVDAYNTSLVRSSPTALSSSRENMCSGSIGDYALFAGGRDADAVVSTVNAYNASLTRSTPTALSVKRAFGGRKGANTGDYLLFAGGETDSDSSKTVDAYNKSLTRSTSTALSTATYAAAGGSVGDYALFAGGEDANYNYISTVVAYNKSLTKSTPTALSVARNKAASASIENYAVFAGGSNRDSGGKAVDAYNKSLVRTTPASFPQVMTRHCGGQANGRAIFALGGSSSSALVSEVYSYDKTLTLKALDNVQEARRDGECASVGNYVLFAGGWVKTSTYSSAVDAYKVSA